MGGQVAELQAQLAAIEARLAETPRSDAGSTAGPVEAAIVSWALSQALGKRPAAGTAGPQQGAPAAPEGEIRVVPLDDIRPTY
ncbi:MAG: hypothetical protein M0Z49_05655, partial [Chloroflexi bacterium]|nr:hypothetical protein [Chloroflexota bacterium]